MYGVMGLANGERHLEYIRTLTEFISQDGIKQVVPMCVPTMICSQSRTMLMICDMGRLSLVNEVEAKIVGLEVMQAL